MKCCVCLEEADELSCKTDCGHPLHFACVQGIQKQYIFLEGDAGDTLIEVGFNCPLCRRICRFPLLGVDFEKIRKEGWEIEFTSDRRIYCSCCKEQIKPEESCYGYCNGCYSGFPWYTRGFLYLFKG